MDSLMYMPSCVSSSFSWPWSTVSPSRGEVFRWVNDPSQFVPMKSAPETPSCTVSPTHRGSTHAYTFNNPHTYTKTGLTPVTTPASCVSMNGNVLYGCMCMSVQMLFKIHTRHCHISVGCEGSCGRNDALIFLILCAYVRKRTLSCVCMCECV